METTEQYGIQETEDVFDLAVSIKEAIQLSKADDGKVDLRNDFANFLRPVTLLPRAFEGARNIPQEWGDLSEAEILRLRDRYGEMVDDERWQRAFVGLVIAGDAIYEIASEKRNNLSRE